MEDMGGLLTTIGLTGSHVLAVQRGPWSAAKSAAPGGRRAKVRRTTRVVLGTALLMLSPMMGFDEVAFDRDHDRSANRPLAATPPGRPSG